MGDVIEFKRPEMVTMDKKGLLGYLNTLKWHLEVVQISAGENAGHLDCAMAQILDLENHIKAGEFNESEEGDE